MPINMIRAEIRISISELITVEALLDVEFTRGFAAAGTPEVR